MLQGSINTRDNAKTEIIAELRGEDGSTALGIYYIGSKKAVYIDASHLLTGVETPDGLGGTTISGAKVKIPNIDLNAIVDGLFDTIGNKIIDAINNISIFQNTKEALEGAIASNTIIIPHNAISSAEDEQKVDVLTLINMIVDCIDIQMDGNIFNITEVKVAITQEVINAILGLVLTGENAGIKIPITNVDLTFANQGVTKLKTLGLNIGLGVTEPLVSLDLIGQIQFGNIVDKETFSKKIGDVIYDDASYIGIMEDGTLDISKFNISLSTGLTLDLQTLEGKIGEINIELGKLGIADDMLAGMFANILLTLGNIQGGLIVNLDASIDLNSGLSLDTLLNSDIRLTINKATNGEQVVYICLSDGYVYLDLSVLFIGVQKVKVKVSDILGLVDKIGGTSSDALAADDGGLLGGIDITLDSIIALVAASLGKIKVTDGFIEIGLAAGLIQNLLDMIGIRGIDIKFEKTEADGGIRLAVPNSLNLDDLQLEVWLAVGSNMDFTVSLDGFKAGIVDVPLGPENPDEFTDVLDAPYVSLDLGLGFDFYGDEGTSIFELGDDDNVALVPFTFNDPMSFKYKLRVAGDLDLKPVLDYLFGATSINTNDNTSELLIEISGSKFGENEKVLLGLYYTGGTLYIDAENFGITKVSTDIDLYELILNLLMKDVNIKINDVGHTVAEALAADDANDQASRREIFFEVLTFLQSDYAKVEVAKGITEAIFSIFGIDTNNAIAYLFFAWDKFEEHAFSFDGDTSENQNTYYLDKMFAFTGAIYNENAQYVGAATVYAEKDLGIKIVNSLDGLKLKHKVYDKDGNLVVDDQGVAKMFALSEYVLASNVHGGFDEIDLFNASKDIVLPTIFAELKGTISLGATAGNDEWTIGEWIANFLDAQDNPALYSFIGDLLLQYNIPSDVARDLGFRIALKARLNPEVPINLTANIRYLELTQDDPSYTEVYKLAGNEFKLLSAEERASFEGTMYIKEYLPEGIPLEELKSLEGLEGDVKVYVKVGDNFRKVDPTKVEAGTKMYVAKNLFDITYILAHSDLAIEIYNKHIDLVDAMTQAEKNSATILALRLVAGENGTSTLYLDFMDDFHMAIDNLNLGSLIGSLLSLVGNDQKKDDSATTAALLDNFDTSNLLGTIKGLLAGVIYSINADKQGFKINFAEGLVTMLINMLTGKQIPADQFLKLNTDTSFFEFYWKYALKLSLGIDPLKLAIGLSSLKFEIGGSASVLPEDFNKSNYMTIDQLDEFSVNMALNIDLTLKKQAEQIRLEKYLDVLITDLGLKLGIDFPKDHDITYGIGLTLGANLALNNPENTKIVLELLNTVEDEIIAGLYIKGSELYVDMGKLSKQAIYVSNTDIADRLCAFIVELMGKIGENAEAVTSADPDAEHELEIMLNIANGKLGLLVTENVILGLIAALAGNDEIANGKSITDIISEFGFDLSLSADMSLDPVEINLDVDSNLIALGIHVADVGIATGAHNATSDTIAAKLDEAITRQDYVLLTDEEKASGLIPVTQRYNYNEATNEYVQAADGDYQLRDHFQQQADAHVLTLDLAFIVDYSACATYALVDETTLANYPLNERYSKNAHDGRFVKDPKGHYVRNGFSYNELIEQLLRLPALKDILATALPIVRFGGENFVSAETDGSLTLGMLLQHLGLSVFLDSAIDDGFLIDVGVKIDFEKLGIFDEITGDLKEIDQIHITGPNILRALELKIEVDFEYENLVKPFSEHAKVGLYFADGELYLDLSGIGSEKIKIEVQPIFDLLGFDLSKFDISIGSIVDTVKDALASADEEPASEPGAFDGIIDRFSDVSAIIAIVNSAITRIQLQAEKWVKNPLLYKIKDLSVFFSANIINDILSLLVGDEVFFESSVLDETQSGIFFNLDDDSFADVYTDDIWSIELLFALANKEDVNAAPDAEDKTYKVDIKLGLNLNVQFESIQTAESLVPNNERLEYISLDEYLENLLNVFNGIYDCTYDEETDPQEDQIYYTFAEDKENGTYIVKNRTFRTINPKEGIAEDTMRYTRGFAMIEGDVAYSVNFVQDDEGRYQYDAENDIYIAYAGAGANNRYNAQIGEAIGEGVKLYNRNDLEAYTDQNISLSISGLLYFDTAGVETYNIGNLVSNLLGEMLMELKTLEAFNSGIGFKLSLNLDLASINFEALLGGDFDLQEFIASSDFTKIELALEFIEVDERNNFVKIRKSDGTYHDKVLGGIYMSHGSLYLDATGIVNVAENYSRIDNFMDLVSTVIDKGTNAIDTIKNLFGGSKEEAQTAADGGEEVLRDAILALVHSDTAFQIQITRSIISLLIASILPDLGSIDEVFDMFDISLNIEHGEEVFTKISDIEDADFRAKFADEYKNDKYAYFANEDYNVIDNVNGKYAAAEIGGVYRYLPINVYKLYHEEMDGSKKVMVANEHNAFIDDNGVTKNYVSYNGKFYEATSLRTRRIGFVKDADVDLSQAYYRSIHYYTRLDQFFVGLDIAIGSMNMGFEVGGIAFGFGAGQTLLPDYIRDSKAHTYIDDKGTEDPSDDEELLYNALDPDAIKNTADLSTNPFYDTVIRIAFSVELNFSITESIFDFGKILHNILGDINGVVFEAPHTAKHYSSAHFRLDFSLMLDMYDITNSELKAELVAITETGYESKWLGLYYLNNSLYIDAEEFFNIPKIAINGLNIRDILQQLLGEDIFIDWDEIGATSSEALAADDSEIDFSNKELALAILISKNNLAIGIGDKMFDLIIGLLTDLTNIDFESIIYTAIDGHLAVTLNTEDGIDLEAIAGLDIAGDRYNVVGEVQGYHDEILLNLRNNSAKYYVFEQAEDTPGAQAGYYLEADDAQYFRAITPVDPDGVRYVRYELVLNSTRDSFKKRMVLDLDENGVAQYGPELDVSNSDKVYILTEGDSVNKAYVADGGKYDIDLKLELAIKDLDVQFINSRNYALTEEDFDKYTSLNDLDRISLTETIEIDASLKKSTTDERENDIDLSELVEYFLPGVSSEEIITLISASSDSGSDVDRKFWATLTVDIQLSALMNYLRTTKFDMGTEEDPDAITYVTKLIDGIKGLLDGGISLEKVLDIVLDVASYIGISIVITTQNGEDRAHGIEPHTVFGIYLVGGTYELMTANEYEVDDDDYVAPEFRYSHYYENSKGSYIYDGSNFVYNHDPNYVGTRYSFDSSYCYSNPLGEYKRVNGGIYIDLSYFNLPSLVINSKSMRMLVANLPNLIAGFTSSDAQVADDGDEEQSGGLSLPLIDDTISGYLKTFIFGLRMTSSYIALMLNPDYVNQILKLIGGEDFTLQFGYDFVNKPEVKIYADNHRYVYTDSQTVLENAATPAEAEAVLNNTRYRFVAEKVSDIDGGMYWIDEDGAYALKTDMTVSERKNYDKEVLAGTKFYYNVSVIDTYVKVGTEYVNYVNATTVQMRSVENDETLYTTFGVNFPQLYLMDGTDYITVETFGLDKLYTVDVLAERNPLIGIQLYLWNYEVALNIQMPKLKADEFKYMTGTEAIAQHVDTPIAARYTTESKELLTAVDRPQDGLYQWKADYYTADAFDLAKYNANPRQYEYKNKYYFIDGDSLCKLQPDQKYKTINELSLEFPDYMKQIAEDGAVYYIHVPDEGYFKLQRSFVYRLTRYDLDGKRLLTVEEASSDEYADPDSYFVRGVQDSVIEVPDFSAPEYDDYAYDSFIDTDDVFYVSLKLSGRIAFEGGKMYFDYDKYRTLYNADPLHTLELGPIDADITNDEWEMLKLISFKYFHGSYVQVTDRAEANSLKKEGALYIWANSELGDKYDGVNEPLNEVLSGILGSMQGYFQVTEKTMMEIFFEIKLNMSFEINFTPAFNIIVRDLDLAIDAWGRQEDLKTNPLTTDEEDFEYVTAEERKNYQGDLFYGSLTHVLGIYYSNDHDTGDAGLYVDLSWLLGNGGKIYIDLSEYTIEDVIGGLVGNLLGGNTASDALAADDEVVYQSPDDASLYLSIFTNALALELSTNFLKVIIAELAPDAGNTI